MSDEPLTPTSAEDNEKVLALFQAAREFVLAAIEQVPELSMDQIWPMPPQSA